jgi:hypothetical protein
MMLLGFQSAKVLLKKFNWGPDCGSYGSPVPTAPLR